MALLESGALPNAEERESIRADLGAARLRTFAQLPRLGDALSARDGMDALRASLAHLDSGEYEGRALIGAAAVFAAAWVRRAAHLAPIAPEPWLRHAAD